MVGRFAMAAVLHGVVAPAAVLAQTAGGDGGNGLGSLALLLNYGILGIVTLLWLTGRIETPKRGDAAERRAEAAEARERELELVLRTEVVPALTRFTEVAGRILDRQG